MHVLQAMQVLPNVANLQLPGGQAGWQHQVTRRPWLPKAPADWAAADHTHWGGVWVGAVGAASLEEGATFCTAREQ